MNLVFGIAIRTVITAFAMAQAWKAALMDRTYKVVKLYKTNVPIGATTNVNNLVEADYNGYAPVAVASFNGPAIDSANNAYITTPEAFFQKTAGGTNNQIFSAGLVGNISGATTATGTVTTTTGVISAPVITLAGDGYLAAPKIKVLGGGTGAVVVATIDSNGAVDSLTLVNGGSGYTAATLDIEPPVELLGGFTFPSPMPMTAGTDAIAVAIQQNIPSGA